MRDIQPSQAPNNYPLSTMPIPWITHPVVVRDYLHKSALPTLPFHWDNVADKEKARISRQRGLSIAPESYRRLETVLCADTRFLETLKKCE